MNHFNQQWLIMFLLVFFVLPFKQLVGGFEMIRKQEEAVNKR